MKKAFTLIELLVVVLIIGILAAIALPQYEKAVEKSRAAEAAITLGSMKRAVDIWIMENGYPTDSDGVWFYYSTTSGPRVSDDVESLHRSLDIDFNSSSKYFAYTAACDPNECMAIVERNDEDFPYLRVEAYKSKSTNTWVEHCRYDDNSKANSPRVKALCSAFSLNPEYQSSH